MKNKKSRKVQGGRRHSSGAGLGRGKGRRRPVSPREREGVLSKAPAPRADAREYIKSMSNEEAAAGQGHTLECRAHAIAVEAAKREGAEFVVGRLSKNAENVMLGCPTCRDGYGGPQ